MRAHPGAEPAGAIECAGAPRDLGVDQGRACAGLVRAPFAALPAWERARWWLLGDRGAGAESARDLRRHFPHQAESLEGLARAAGVPVSWLAQRLGADSATGARALALGARAPRAAQLARSVEAPGVLRRSRPEGRFESLSWSPPDLPAALAGVNEAGLAAAVASLSPPDPLRAPAALLVQDCLERFDSLEASIDWCAGRPAGGRAWILLADARGEIAGVEIDGATRRVVRPAEAFLHVPGPAAPDAAKQLRESADTRDALAALRAQRVVLLDPAERRLALATPDPVWHRL